MSASSSPSASASSRSSFRRDGPVDASRESAAVAGPATGGPGSASEIPALRKAAILLVSLEQSVSSRLLAGLAQDAVEAVTWEIARMDRVDPAEQAAVLEEFLGLGLRRLCFVFDDVLRMADAEIRAAFRPEDAEAWALALAGSAPPLRARVLGALHGSAALTLQRHLDGLGPFRLSDTEVAQVEVAERIRGLYDQGSIDLPDPSGQEELLA